MSCQFNRNVKPIYYYSLVEREKLTFNDGIRGQLLDKTLLLVCIQIEMEGIN